MAHVDQSHAPTALKHDDCHKRFLALTHPSPPLFVDNIRAKVLTTLANGSQNDMLAFLEHKLLPFQKLQHDISSLKEQLLSVVGFGKDIQELQHIAHHVSQMIASLEDLVCNFLEG